MLKFRDILNTKLNKKGFTLAELLVVVAILAILVAVSIPIFTGRLKAAKEATDAANIRAAKAVAVTEILSEKITADGTYYYDAENGKLETGASDIVSYGKVKDGTVVKVEVKIGTDTDNPTVDAKFEAGGKKAE